MQSNSSESRHTVKPNDSMQLCFVYARIYDIQCKFKIQIVTFLPNIIDYNCVFRINYSLRPV